jgi:hypothetical protein
MPTIPDFIRSTPPASLRDYFTAINVTLPADVVWEGAANEIVAPLLRAVDAMSDADRLRVMTDADRVGVMAKNGGPEALYAVTTVPDHLDSLGNDHARALWMFLKDPAGFNHAEEVRYADDRRFGRMWDGFKCQGGIVLPRTGAAVDAFRDAIAKRFDSRHVELEICERSRPSREGVGTELIQTAIYREGRASDMRAFVNGKLDRQPVRPVIEAAITYEPANGIVEVVAPARETREELVKMFAEHLLSAPFGGGRIPLRQYRIDNLRRPFDFPTAPSDGIESVRVTAMRLMPLDTQSRRITLECMRGSTETIWQVAADELKNQEHGIEGYRITEVRFTIRFRPSPGGRGGRTLPVTITMPQGCDLKDRTGRERLIGEKYLRLWKLVRDV